MNSIHFGVSPQPQIDSRKAIENFNRIQEGLANCLAVTVDSSLGVKSKELSALADAARATGIQLNVQA